MKKSLATLLLLGTAWLPAHAELIKNGNFNDDIAFWNCKVTGEASCDVRQTGGYKGGAAFVGYQNVGNGVLSQSFATEIGRTYDLTFYAQTGQVENRIGYRFGPGTITWVTSPTDFGLTTASFVATAASTTLNFFFSTQPRSGSVWLDEVSVLLRAPLPEAQAPEPASLGLMALGLLGLGAAVRRRKVSRA